MSSHDESSHPRQKSLKPWWVPVTGLADQGSPLLAVFSGITDAAEEQVMSEQLRHEGVSGQVQAIAGMHLSGVDSWPIPAETPAGPARAEEFLLVELERALMRVYASTHDSRLLDRLQLLLAHHEARGYLDTLPVADRYALSIGTLTMYI